MSAAPRAVAIGGGTGLPLVLRCLADSGFDTTAIVTVADDGGSSGQLRRELGMLPPGDIRNCLVALAAPDSPLAEVFQYRFPVGEGLAGHALGNLVIAALADMRGGFVEGIQEAGRMLGVRGLVLPSTLADVVLSAEDDEGGRVRGQVNVARSPAPVRRVHTDPPSPAAYPPALDAIARADLVVIGPGSLYTSIIPNLLVAGVCSALESSPARVVYVCNVANQRGETTDMNAAEHVAALLEHGLEDALDVVVVHDTDAAAQAAGVSAVEAGAETRALIASWGITVVVDDLADPDVPLHHDRTALCRALRRVAGVVHG